MRSLLVIVCVALLFPVVLNWKPLRCFFS
jgi:hypothetical protein